MSLFSSNHVSVLAGESAQSSQIGRSIACHANRSLGERAATEGIEPIRQAWWMKHLSLLAVLQAACLATGLMFFTGPTGGISSSFLSTFAWITCIQGGLSYLIFSRLYRYYNRQHELLADQVEEQGRALNRTRDAMILGLTRLAEIRDGETEGHLDRVGLLSARLAEQARKSPEFSARIDLHFIHLLKFSAALHDIGKVGIEDSILLKPGELTVEERSRMEHHTRISSQCLNEIEDCLGDANFLQMAHEIALFHHERWDGSGYPTGLAGEQIPLAARLVAIADVYDALAARRPYKEPYDHERCVEIIAAEAGTHFDPRLVDAFLAIQHEFAEISQGQETTTIVPVNQPHAELSAVDNQLDSLMNEVDAVLPTR